MRQIETVGTTREEAIKKALAELGVEMADVDNIEVLDEGSKGFLGLGSRPVKVRVTAKKSMSVEREQKYRKSQVESAEKGTSNKVQGKGKDIREQLKSKTRTPDKVIKKSESGSTPKKAQQTEKQEKKNMMSEQPPIKGNEESHEKKIRVNVTDAQGNEASALLAEMLQKMGIESTVKFVRTEDGTPKLIIESQEGALLIGKRGSHLETIQFLVNHIFSGVEESGEITERFVVDTENYIERRKETLRQMALSSAERAKRGGRKIKLPPMPSNERRVIHLTLQNDNSVETFSVGKGDSRYVVIAPKNRYQGRRQWDSRDRRDRFQDNRYSRRPQNRRGGRRDYNPDWKRGRSGHSPYDGNLDSGQISE
ncbi:MAG TPA: RNA-binding cell elongation regulator Jag/EloR [Candidatus Hydrogenedens sp.]|nr:RNA-binding cell elongation regulator Jag/EloR [Candidatus Hydrogenedens sp.]